MDLDANAGGGGLGDIPTRPMKVKILYTFDDDNKTNCLARFPDTLNIPTVAIDDTTQVGVIELCQCVQAITAASPEIISRLGQGDFTIYAYDYSEYETPLVGQGLLSALLAAKSTTPNAPAHQSKTRITGRVCQNVLGLFNNGVKETLEVKLRLVPVPKQVQNEYVKSMEMFRNMTPTSSGFDPNGWAPPLQNSQSQQSDYFADMNTMSMGSQEPFDLFVLETGGYQPAQDEAGSLETPTDSAYGSNPAFATHSYSAPGSRSGSPLLNPQVQFHSDSLRHQSFSGQPSAFGNSRPASRAGSTRSEVQPSQLQRQDSYQSAPQQETTEYYNEDGQSRKRAKVTPADFHGRSSFGTRSSNLLVTAATAASMHMHRPVATRPSAPGSNLEPPPRVPTPVPHMNRSLPQPRERLPSKSLLRQASIARSESLAGSDFMSDADQMSDAIMSSPDEDSPDQQSADGTPQDFPSSPPAFPGMYIQPSSPGLPTLPKVGNRDSGYMSELTGIHSEAIAINDDDEEDRSPDAEDLAVAAQYQSRSRAESKRSDTVDGRERTPLLLSESAPMTIMQCMPGPADQLPSKMLLNLPPGRRQTSEGPGAVPPKPTRGEKLAFTSMINGQSNASAPGSRRGSLALPSMVAQSDPSSRPPLGQSATTSQVPTLSMGQNNKPPMQRSRTMTYDSEAGSPAPSDNEGPTGNKRSGSGAKRRKMIQDRLMNSVAAGTLPTYCSHCGAIETPTWRKLYVKVVDEKPSELDLQEDVGEAIGVDSSQTDPVTGATLYRILKTMKGTKSRDDYSASEFTPMTVCNPCGLWFNKLKVLRPPEKWNRKPGSRRSRKPKSATQQGTDGTSELQSDMPSEAFYTDALQPEESTEEPVRTTETQPLKTSAAPPPMVRPRANSMQTQQRQPSGDAGWNSTTLDAALSRAIQSSPARFHGTQESPIELDDLTPKPTRRLLFPSPRRNGEAKTLENSVFAQSLSVSPSEEDPPQKPTTPSKLGGGDTDVTIFETFTEVDKENMPPPLDADDDLAHLFEGSPSAFFKTPRKTPCKTPSKRTPRALDAMADILRTPTPISRKRKPLTPNANAANGANDFMTSSASLRGLIPSTPSRFGLSPSRSNNLGELTPFTAHLAQMLNDANASVALSSPSRPFDFSDLPTFLTPGRTLDFGDFGGVMSSDFGVYDDSQEAQDTAEVNQEKVKEEAAEGSLA